MTCALANAGPTKASHAVVNPTMARPRISELRRKTSTPHPTPPSPSPRLTRTRPVSRVDAGRYEQELCSIGAPHPYMLSTTYTQTI